MIDSVALWSCRGLPECIIGTLKRDFIPACGPEAAEGDDTRKAEIVACSSKLAEDLKVKWTGGKDHPSNPWLHFARPNETVKVCTSTGVCGEAVGK